MATLYGFVTRILYQSENFFVLTLEVAQSEPKIHEKTVTVSGSLYGLSNITSRISIQFLGDWVRHPKYGKQFQPCGWVPWVVSDVGAERFLKECIQGFEDATMVEDLVATFGTLVFEKLSDSPDEVKATAPEGTPRRMALESALLFWNEARALSNLSVFLQGFDLSEDVTRAIFRRFGSDAINLIAENPYRLVAVEGFTFAKADKLANRSGIGKEDPRRMDGAVLWILKTEAQNGHLSVRRGDFETLLRGLMAKEDFGFGFDGLQANLMSSVDRLVESGIIRLDPNVGVYLPDLFQFEREGARKLVSFLTPAQLDLDLKTFLEEYEKGNAIQLSPAQQEAVFKLIQNRVLVITGQPGTGKTTLVRALVRLFKTTGLTFLLTAPTGIAAKRLSAVTEEAASTVHRALGWDGSNWAFNGQNKYSVGAVVLDETSMVDQELFYRLLDALHPSTFVVIVGDDAQLPSVGPGNVLRELLACPRIPHVRLTQIFRQSEESAIVVAAHKIHKGESPLVEKAKPDSEFQFVSLTDEERLVSLIVQMCVKLKGRDANFQVLSPKYDGAVGVDRLNEAIREKLNPADGQREWKAGKQLFREGDRVMVVKNEYKLNISNGDMGKLLEIHKDTLRVRIHGIGPKAPDSYVDIPKNQASRLLRLAYTITVHRCQGSEFDTIILPMLKEQGRMLQRNLFYTAVTRAKKKAWILGDSAAVFKALANDKVAHRNTVFAAVLSGVEGPEAKP